MPVHLPSPILSYESNAISRRRRRRAVSLLIIIPAALLSWWSWGAIKVFRARVHQRWIVRQCENYQLPPDTVVYETDPSLAGAYAKNPLYVCLAGNPPSVSRRAPLLMSSPWNFTYFSDDAVFCHWRTSPSGNRRLIIVAGFLDGVPDAMVFDPGSLMTPPVELSTTGVPPWSKYEILTATNNPFAAEFWAWHNNPLFTLYAGQPDPHDASHFTFRYVAKRGSGTIDGWLLDNDKVRFRALAGPYGHPLSYFAREERNNDD